MQVVKMQAAARGHLGRKRVKAMKAGNVGQADAGEEDPASEQEEL
jgi:hypothetical protein